MAAQNDITKDKLISKPNNDKYRAGWDRIFNVSRGTSAKRQK